MQTATPSASTTAVGVRYGLLTGLLGIIFSFIILITGQLGSSWLGLVSLLVIPGAGIWLAQREFKAKNEGFMSYGQGLGIGIVVSAVMGVVSVLFSYIHRTFIDPTITEQMADQMRAKFEQSGSMSDAQIDQAIAMSQKFSTGPIGIVVGLLTFVIVGLVLSLIISAILKNSRPEFE